MGVWGWVWVWFLHVTLILLLLLLLCQSGTPVLKKLLCIELTVRLFLVTRWTDLPALMKDRSEGLRHFCASTRLFLPDMMFYAVTCRRKQSWWVSAFFLFFFFSHFVRGAFWIACDCIHKHRDSETDLYPGIYMHWSADQILVVVVLMFVTCVHNKTLCNLLR